ncbi:hypothetical protein BDZ45DRAFT_799288 [Acephala macrosclerotiorum]|nr:hypothetical protein BDZ45DRAFT_799288 [Acephala macrosclerotiorum]
MAENPDAREPCRYAPDELLGLRSSLPFVTCAIKKLNQHPDLACILRIPDRARRDPENFSCSSRMLVEITNRSQQEDGDASWSHHRVKQNRQLQWALRKRESSDRSSQPHSAPTDTAAQHSENFQKFYRAVVSPTHVRVTAGGRIVPNTRATAPPLLEWNNDKSSFEPTKQISNPETNSAQPIWSPNPQLNSGFAPLISNTFLPPYNLLSQGNSLTMPNMAPQFSHAVHGSEHGSFDNSANPQLSIDAGGNLAQAGMIKLSHPAQFDGSRPYMINGQVVYPVSVGGPQLPFGMLGNPNYFPPSPMAPAGFMPQHFPLQMPNSMAFPPGHPAMLAAGLTPPSEGLPTMAPFLPMPGAILDTDALNSQVAALRQQLKNVEDQLADNIDPGFIGHQRVFLQSQINHLEAMIEHQRIHRAKEFNGSNGFSGNGSNGNRASGNATMSQNTSKQPSTGVGPSAEINRQAPAVVSSSMATGKNAEKNRGSKLAPHTEIGKTRSEPGTKSRLTIAAAMAPPFQPRSQTLVGQNNHAVAPATRSPSPDFIALLEANPKWQAELTARLVSKAEGNWSSPNPPYVTFSQGPPRQVPVSKSVQAPIQQSDTFHVNGSTNGATEDKFVMPANAVPYLVGTLPHGVNTTMANATEFMYPRGLTDEEVRARYLYWGKAPRSVQSGLPKFDGKDFYPPSPVKNSDSLIVGKDGVTFSRHPVTGALMQNPNFDRIFLSPSPKGASKSCVMLGPVPPQPNFRNGAQHHAASQSQGSIKMGDELNGSDGAENCRALALRSCTPPSDGADFAESVEENRIRETIIYYNKAERESPVTPQDHGHSGEDAAEYDEVRTQDSWERNETEARYNSNTANYGPSQSVGSDLGSASTVDFDLGSQGRFASAEQCPADTKKAEQQTLFLQGILKNDAPMVGSALSGTISSATAQGYLPPYRGSAAASFTPTVMNSQNPGLGADNMGAKHGGKLFTGPAPAMAFLSENVPFNSERYPRSIIPPQNAEAYMRYLALKKNEDNKQVGEQGWNANTTGTGSVNGSNW